MVPYVSTVIMFHPKSAEMGLNGPTCHIQEIPCNHLDCNFFRSSDIASKLMVPKLSG